MTSWRGQADVIVGSEILCKVQEALEDLIVVSYHGRDGKIFQGVLLDSTKRNIPFGISPPGGFQKQLSLDNPRDYAIPRDENSISDTKDTFPTISSRQTYFQESKEEKSPLMFPSVKGSTKSFLTGQENKRLGVRLRARQVLCSKCSSVCNEKGENVRENARREREPKTHESNFKSVEDPERKRVTTKLVESFVPTNTYVKSNKIKGFIREKLVSISKHKPSNLTRKIKKVIRRPRVETYSIDSYDNDTYDSDSTTCSNDSRKKVITKRVCRVPRIVDLDIFQYNKTRKLAKRDILVPKIRKLNESEIQRLLQEHNFSDGDNSVTEDTEYPYITNNLVVKMDDQIVSSSTEFNELASNNPIPIPCNSENNMLPLKIKFSNLTEQTRKNNLERQYSIVKSQENSLVFRANFGDNDNKSIHQRDILEESDLDKKSDKVSVFDNQTDEENQPLNKVSKKDNSDSNVEQNKPGPVLKISLGKGSTLIKFPSVAKDTNTNIGVSGDTDIKNDLCPSTMKIHRSAVSKAARKALRKAKKEAQRKANTGIVSPARNYLGCQSPHNPWQSPAHRSTLPSPARGYGGGSLSPGRFPGTSPGRFSSPGQPGGSASPAYTLLCPSSQKIIIKKVKKKKHKKDKDKEILIGKDLKSKVPLPTDSSSLGSLSSTFEDQTSGKHQICREPSQSGIPGIGGCSKSENSDIAGDFRQSNIVEKPSLTVDSAILTDGHTMYTGDVVWGRGKVNSWWPGKVLNIMMIEESSDKEEDQSHAQISWYTSTTTAIIPCSDVRPFLEFYEVQYNNKEEGEYKEAVRLAIEDARQASSIPLSGLSPSPSTSPREVLV